MNLKSQEETAVEIFESFPVRMTDGRQMHTRGRQVKPSPAEEKCSSEVCVSKRTAALLLSAQSVFSYLSSGDFCTLPLHDAAERVELP